MQYRVLQWNVWFREKAENILEQIKELDTDIVCLQELTTDSYINPKTNLPKKIAALGYFYHFWPTLDRKGVEYYQMGNGIFSKYPIVASHQVYLQLESNEHENRIYIEVELDTPDGPLYVGTTHLSWAPSAALAEMDKLLETLAHRTERFVFTGDLNVGKGSHVLEKIEKRLRTATTDHLPTWPTKPYQFHGISIKELDRQLDYIFTTEDIRVLSTRTIDTAHSDHLPLLARIEL